MEITICVTFFLGLIFLIIQIIAPDDEGKIAFSYVSETAFLITIFFLLFYDSGRPTALDVYRGKTELKVKYNNSMAIDSIVVFK